MNTIKINYDDDTDETKIEFSDEFFSLPPRKQLEAMEDGLDLLNRSYNNSLSNIL